MFLCICVVDAQAHHAKATGTQAIQRSYYTSHPCAPQILCCIPTTLKPCPNRNETRVPAREKCQPHGRSRVMKRIAISSTNERLRHSTRERPNKTPAQELAGATACGQRLGYRPLITHPPVMPFTPPLLQSATDDGLGQTASRRSFPAPMEGLASSSSLEVWRMWSTSLCTWASC